MYKMSSNFHVSSFRSRVSVWALLAALSWSFLPSLGAAQQPTATISSLSGTVLVNAQEQGIGTVLNSGDVIETQAGASVVLELSDGSQLELGENTKLDIAVLAQTATSARVSRVKLLWGRIRAFLSPQHQIEGSAFNIETPNALIGVKFSEPDIEVSYNLEKAETVGIAHTVELMAKNLLTNEDVLVPVGSSVIIVGTTVKIVAGILAVAGATETGTTGAGATEAASTGTGATSTGTSSTGSSGMGTGTKVALGVGAAAAVGGVAALAAGSGDGGGSDSDDSCTTAECTGDLSGGWSFTGSCVAQGCTEDVRCFPAPYSHCCGTGACDCCDPSIVGFMQVSQAGNILTGIRPGETPGVPLTTLNGVVNGNLVSFTIPQGVSPAFFGPDDITEYTGVVEGDTIRGDFTGSGPAWTTTVGHGPDWDVIVTWSGTFTVDIEK